MKRFYKLFLLGILMLFSGYWYARFNPLLWYSKEVSFLTLLSSVCSSIVSILFLIELIRKSSETISKMKMKYRIVLSLVCLLLAFSFFFDVTVNYFCLADLTEIVSAQNITNIYLRLCEVWVGSYIFVIAIICFYSLIKSIITLRHSNITNKR